MGLRANFAGNLRKIRAAKGLSQEDVALEADVNRTYISDLEREVYSASLDLVEKIAAALNVDPLDLLQSPSPRSKEKLVQAKRKRSKG
jgi:transcriptional regulator with XRE-family HTH domain